MKRSSLRCCLIAAALACVASLSFAQPAEIHTPGTSLNAAAHQAAPAKAKCAAVGSVFSLKAEKATAPCAVRPSIARLPAPSTTLLHYVSVASSEAWYGAARKAVERYAKHSG